MLQVSLPEYKPEPDVNDMKAAVACKLLQYADDTALLLSGKDVLEIERILSVELGAVSEWLCENRLSLHLGKTQSILFLFGLKKRISKCQGPHGSLKSLKI